PSRGSWAVDFRRNTRGAEPFRLSCFQCPRIERLVLVPVLLEPRPHEPSCLPNQCLLSGDGHRELPAALHLSASPSADRRANTALRTGVPSRSADAVSFCEAPCVAPCAGDRDSARPQLMCDLGAS